MRSSFPVPGAAPRPVRSSFLSIYFRALSTANALVDGRAVESALLRIEPLPPGLFAPLSWPRPPPLPDAATAAAWLRGAELEVAFLDGSGRFRGRVTEAAPVPEPAAGTLLLLGLVGIDAAARQRRTRRSAVLQ